MSRLFYAKFGVAATSEFELHSAEEEQHWVEEAREDRPRKPDIPEGCALCGGHLLLSFCCRWLQGGFISSVWRVCREAPGSQFNGATRSSSVFLKTERQSHLQFPTGADHRFNVAKLGPLLDFQDPGNRVQYQ
jgi:hypothetical protein